MEPPAKEIASGPHLGGIDIGLRDHSTSQKDRDLVGVDAIVLGLSAVDGFHVEGMAEDEWDLFAGTEVGEPVPGEHALGGDDEVLTERFDGAKEGAGRGPDLLVEAGLTLGIEDAEVEGTCVQVDAAVE